jgi:hypothetical protein
MRLAGLQILKRLEPAQDTSALQILQVPFHDGHVRGLFHIGIRFLQLKQGILAQG